MLQLLISHIGHIRNSFCSLRYFCAMVQGRKLRFSHSQSKHRLFVGNIPKAWDKEELEKVLGEQGPGIQSVELLKV
jgi:hypothetical protein